MTQNGTENSLAFKRGAWGLHHTVTWLWTERVDCVESRTSYYFVWIGRKSWTGCDIVWTGGFEDAMLYSVDSGDLKQAPI